MTRIYLVRHGQTTFNAERRIQGQMESDLTPEGEQQAIALRKKLKDISFSALYVSPLRRTRRTAELLTEGFGLEPIYLDELKEILMGDWQGRLVSDLETEFAEELDTFWHHPENFARPTCETYQQVRNRAASAMETMVQRHPGQNVLVVTHGALLKTLYTFFKYQPIHDIANAPHPHSTGLCIVEKKDGVWAVLDWDNVDHLLHA